MTGEVVAVFRDEQGRVRALEMVCGRLYERPATLVERNVLARQEHAARVQQEVRSDE